jgi:hypothetical protein
MSELGWYEVWSIVFWVVVVVSCVVGALRDSSGPTGGSRTSGEWPVRDWDDGGDGE